MMLTVLIAGGGAAWEATLVAALDAEPALQVARRCVDVVDLLAAAGAGLGRVALVAADLRRLDGDAVDRLLAADVVPVGVVSRGDEAAEDRMRSLGVEFLVPADADPAVVAGVLAEAEVSRAGRPPGQGDGADVRRPGHLDGDPARRGRPASPSRNPAGAAPCSRCGARPARRAAPRWRSPWPTSWPGSGTRPCSSTPTCTAPPSPRELGLLDESPGIAAACRLASSTRLTGADPGRAVLAAARRTCGC